MQAVKKAVPEARRDAMASDLRAGIIDLRYRIDLETEAGVSSSRCRSNMR